MVKKVESMNPGVNDHSSFVSLSIYDEDASSDVFSDNSDDPSCEDYEV